MVDIDLMRDLRVNQRVKRAFPFILFFIGFLIQLAALFGEHATEIPFVLRAVAPHYFHALAGERTLKIKFGLESKDEGYQEISKILVQRVFTETALATDQQVKADIRICRIYDSQKTIQSVGANLYRRPFYYSVVSSNSSFVGGGQDGGATNFICDIDRLQEPIEKLKETNILVFCIGMFFLGSIVEFIAFFIEYRESHGTSEKHINRNEQQSAKPTK